MSGQIAEGLSSEIDERRRRQLVISVRRRAPLDSVVLLLREEDTMIAAVLQSLDPTLAIRILAQLPSDRGSQLAPVIESRLGEQWDVNLRYSEDAVGRIMEPPTQPFHADQLVADVVLALRPIAEQRQLVYLYVVDAENHLQGVVAMRELLFANVGDRLSDIMTEEPFYLRAGLPVTEAMQLVLKRHYPMYPVCDEHGRLEGLVQGYALFERHSLELSAQVGRMVGVEREEHFTTPWLRCLVLRHPWLQLNLLTAFLAGAMVGLFEDTIARIVALAAFLPVLAGQSGNTGSQALAVTLRGLVLNELKPGMERRLVGKEALLGLCNGLLVGLSAGIGMFAYASLSSAPSPLLLSAVVFIAMVASCIASGMAGAAVPLLLRALGADPATASSIFLTTATDIASIGLLLGLTTLIVL